VWEHLIDDAVCQRMFVTLGTVPYMGCRHRADAEFILSGTDLEHTPEDSCPI